MDLKTNFAPRTVKCGFHGLAAAVFTPWGCSPRVLKEVGSIWLRAGKPFVSRADTTLFAVTWHKLGLYCARQREVVLYERT